jgi:hypothetical protein
MELVVASTSDKNGTMSRICQRPINRGVFISVFMLYMNFLVCYSASSTLAAEVAEDGFDDFGRRAVNIMLIYANKHSIGTSIERQTE